MTRPPLEIHALIVEAAAPQLGKQTLEDDARAVDQARLDLHARALASKSLNVRSLLTALRLLLPEQDLILEGSFSG